MSVTNGKLLAYIAAKGEIISTQYSEDQVVVHCKLPQKYLGRIDPTDVIVTPHDPTVWPESQPRSSTPDTNKTTGPISDAALNANPNADNSDSEFEAILTPTEPIDDPAHPLDPQ